MSTDSSMETDGKSSFVSNTDAVIYGTGTGYSSEYEGQSLISDPNITSSSSSSDALITASSRATSSRFEINKNHQQEVSILKVDFKVLVEDAEAEAEDIGSCDEENIFRALLSSEELEELLEEIVKQISISIVQLQAEEFRRILVEKYRKFFGRFSDKLKALEKDLVCSSNISLEEEILKRFKIEILWLLVEEYRKRLVMLSDKSKAPEKDPVCSRKEEILEEILKGFKIIIQVLVEEDRNILIEKHRKDFGMLLDDLEELEKDPVCLSNPSSFGGDLMPGKNIMERKNCVDHDSCSSSSKRAKTGETST